METFRTDYFPPSNRRRCVKGRSSYTDSSDTYLSTATCEDQNSNGFSQNEDSYIDSVQSEDVEEDITIDLSAFLNDNPLLAQAAFEASSENNVAATESSSQFRVTDCKVDPSEIPKAEVTNTLLSVNVNGDTSVDNNVANENINVFQTAKSHTFIHTNAKENCLTPEKILTNVTNSEPAQSITLNGKKTPSPTKKFSKALGLSNPLKKYKNFIKSKDLNKVNEKVFGKYPIVKCEKLDIENFVKNNKIKIRNWPLLQTENQKSNSSNKVASKKKVNLNKSNLKPKFMKKPISFNKYLIAADKHLANQNINILGDQSDISKPIIIKTDSWKPEVANVAPCVPSFFRPLTKSSLSTSKNVVCDVLKLNDKTVSLNVISSPKKKSDVRTNTIATNLNKLFNIPKSYPLIAPKPPNIHPLTTTKPVIETLTVPVAGNFTVIEPYVDDPKSPQKPKPILTVPVEVVPSPEKQNSVINPNIISNGGVITNTNNSEKLLKAEKSVFLNGGIKKIIIPTKTKSDVSVIQKEVIHRKNNQENLLNEVVPKVNIINDVVPKVNIINEVVPKVPIVLKVSDDVSSEESVSVLKAKNLIVDAMQSAFCSTQSKKNPKSRSVKKSAVDLPTEKSLLGSSAYSCILNDNILNGFSENDFEDVSLFEDDSFTDISSEMSPPREFIIDKVMVAENSSLTPRSIKKARERKKYKRKKSLEDSLEINSSLSASECENEGKLGNDKRIVLFQGSNIENNNSSVNKNCEKSINIPVHSKTFNESVNKDFETKHIDSSHLFTNFENHISESQDSPNDNKFMSPKIVEQNEIPLSSLNEKAVHNVNSPVKKTKENDNLIKQETSTRTLRDRKCSSTEVKKFINSTKLNSPEKKSPEKNKVKGSINSKLKIQLKSPKSSSNIKLKKKSSKPADIIQEINTITGGHSVPKRGSPKIKKSYSEKDIKNSDNSNINSQNNSEFNSSNMSLFNQPSISPLSKQRKTLKVCIKRSKKKITSCSKMSLNTLTDVVDNANISNSVSESNLSLHSSFREAKDEKMGTRQNEENSPVITSPIPDCKMENSNEKLDEKEPADSPNPMVNSSETSLLEDNSNINSVVNCTLSDNFLMIENEDNMKELPSDIANHKDKVGKKENQNFSSIYISNSENDSGNSENLVKDNSNSALEMLSPLPIKNSENDSESYESLVKENNYAVMEITLPNEPLPVENSKDTMLSSEDNVKNSENDSESYENLIKENDTAVIEILPALVVENSRDGALSESDSVELINKANAFSIKDNSNYIFNANLHNICDVTLNSTENQNNENTFKEIENTSAKIIAGNSEISVENEIFKGDFIPEETVIEEVVTTEVDDDSKFIPNNPHVDISIDDEEDKSNHLTSVDTHEEFASNPNENNVITEEEIIVCSNVPMNDLQIDKSSGTSYQCTEELKTSVPFPDNSILIEKEILVEDSVNTFSDHTNYIPENVSHKLSEKCEDFSENVKSSFLLKSVVDDRITVSKETDNVADNFPSDLRMNNCDKNSQINDINSNVSCSDATSKKEILCSEVNFTKEPQKRNCQINEVKPNVSYVNSEAIDCEFHNINILSADKPVNTVSEEETLCPEVNCTEKHQKQSCLINETELNVSSVSDEAFELESDNINIMSADEIANVESEKEIVSFEINSIVDSEKQNCQINKVKLNASSVSSETFESESDNIKVLNADKTANIASKKEIISSEMNSITENEKQSCQINKVKLNAPGVSYETFEHESDNINVINADKTANIVSKKEIIFSEINATVESEKESCQIDNVKLSAPTVSGDVFEPESANINIMSNTVSEKEILPIEKKIDTNLKSNDVKSKKCPKIKIFKKTDTNSPDSLKNWFISESNEAEIKSFSGEALDMMTVETTNLNLTTSLNDNSCATSNLDDHQSVDKSKDDTNIGDPQTSPLCDLVSEIDASDAVLPEKTRNSCSTEIHFTDEKVLTETDKTSSEGQFVEKNTLFSEEIPMPDEQVPSRNTNMCINKNLPPPVCKELPKASLSEKENNNIHPVIIKEEPIDIEENSESTNSCIFDEKAIKTEQIPNKRKRGRPCKSIEYCNKSLDFGQDEVIVKREETAISVIPEIKEEKVTVKPGIKTTPRVRSTGQKRRSNPIQVSTPSSGRKKNYDSELVCVPFSMGWMREHVIRATGKDNKRNSDIYYFSPEGTKLRSMPDILTYLSKHPHIKLSAVNFTFAKELIYREPFEIERDAKQPTKKLSTTPTPKKIPKTPKALLFPADNTGDISSLVESNKKETTLKRKSSTLNESELSPKAKDTTLNSSNISKKSKESTITEFLDDNSKESADKPSRPSRKIVKKVPFDNSEESQPSKKVKSDKVLTRNSSENDNVEESPHKKAKSGTIVTRNSSGDIKINIKKAPIRESLVVKIPLKSPSKVTKENKLQNSESATEVKSECNVNIAPNTSDKLSSKAKKSKNESSVNKSLITSESSSSEALLSRTNIKSPLIQKRLKVKLGQRKIEPLWHKPCTKFCNFSYARLPTIQCTVCFCMFHPECIPFKPTGQIKYACVPCVATRLPNSSDEVSEDFVLPDDFDVKMLYPVIALNIMEDPLFNSIYNKFYSPVDQSFVHTIRSNDIRCQRPLQTYGVNKVAYYLDKNSLNPLHVSTPRPNSAAVYSPRSFTVRNMSYCFPKAFAVQKSDININNAYLANPSSSTSVQQKTTNSSSLPLLQNFSNAFFVQSQPFNNASQSSSINFQTLLPQPSTTTKVPLGTFTKADGSKVQRTLFVQNLTNNQQNVSDHTKNISVLQNLLQSNSDLSNKAIKLVKLNDFSTLRISGNNIPSPLSINVTSEINPYCPSKQASSSTPSECNDNKRKNDDNSDVTPKKLKCNYSLETKKFIQASSSPHKIMNVHSFSEQLSTCWNMNKFAQIYECLNFIFKFLNVSDLLRASLVCKSWNHLATQKLLWERVTFSGITIKDWVKCCKTLQKHGTKCIDFRGLYDQDSDNGWKTFLENVHRLTDVEELIFEKVPPYVVKQIADSLPQLKKLTCFCLTSVFTEPEIWSTPCAFELASLRCLGRLEALKISSMGGIHLKDNQLSLLPYLPNLTHLVLSGFKFNSCINLECLSQMQQLITLELGDCTEIEPQVYGLISQLKNLENLCLQNGGDINDKKLSEVLSKMDKLKTLELMNFQLSFYISDALKKIDTLHFFSLWPDSRIKGEQVNFNSFKAATSCSNVKRLCWGILTDDDSVPNTLELKDSEKNEVKRMSFQELFQSLVKHNPGAKVELKCLPRSIWSEFCSTRNFM